MISAWKTRDFGVTKKLLNMILQISSVKLFSSQWFIANTTTDPGEESLRKARERALRAKAEVNGYDVSGTKVTYDILCLSF